MPDRSGDRATQAGGNQTEHASARPSTPRPSPAAKLEAALASLDKPWTILRAKEAETGGRTGAAFIGLHPEKGIALIDLEPARPSHAVAGLRVALIRAQNAGFTVREPPIVPVVLSRDEISSLAARLDAAFAELPRCAIQNRDWPDLAVASLTAEHAQLVPLARRPKAAPAAAAKPETAKRAEPSPITVQRDELQRGKDAGNAPREGRPAAPRRDQAPGDARPANGSSVYPSLLRRPDIEPPAIDSSQLDVSRMMRNLKPRRIDAARSPEQSKVEPLRPERNHSNEQERLGSSPKLRAASDANAPPPQARVAAGERIFEPEWNPTYPAASAKRGRGKVWTAVGALSAMLAVLVVLPPQATGPVSSIRSTADAPAQPSERPDDAAVQTPHFATGQGSPLGDQPSSSAPLSRQEQQVMKAQDLPLPKEEPPTAPAVADAKPPAAAPTAATLPAPRKHGAKGAAERADTGAGAPAQTAAAEATKDRTSAAAAKPRQKKLSSATSRPPSVARKPAPKDGQKPQPLEEASGAIGLPPATALKPVPKEGKTAQDAPEASGTMTYVEGREPRILGTITGPAAADGAAAPQANPEARPAPPGPLSPATDFSITPQGVMAPSGVVMPFDRQ